MRTAIPVALAVIALTGCGVAATPGPAGPAAPARRSTSAAVWAAPSHTDRRPSWIAPEIKGVKTQLLFVSDAGTGDVYMYKLPALELVGTITGFSQPQGECAGAGGDVWITDTNAQTIYEVSHEGRLKNALTDSAGYPDGCAWNPQNGDLAVSNLFDVGGKRGSVLVYPRGSQHPGTYVNPHQYYYGFAGYDASGNLFFDGRAQRGAFMLSELPSGGKSARTIEISGGRIYFPGMVQWDATSSQLLVGDQECRGASAACVYELTLAASTATIAGTVTLRNSSGGRVCDLVQGVEANGEIAGSDNEFCGYTASTTDLWPYPAGGKPAAHNARTDSTPVGAALSGGS